MASKGKGGSTVSVVWDLAEPLAAELGLRLWDVRFVKEGAEWYLKIIIDKPGGIDINDCENMSKAIDKPLDDADPIEQGYHLEVSSPGIERDLRRDFHFTENIGEKIMFRLIRPLEKVRDFKGILAGYDNGNFTAELNDGRQIVVNKKEVSYVRLDDFKGFN